MVQAAGDRRLRVRQRLGRRPHRHEGRPRRRASGAPASRSRSSTPASTTSTTSRPRTSRRSSTRSSSATTRAATTSSTRSTRRATGRWTTTATAPTSRASSPPRRTATSSSASRRRSTCTRSRSSTRPATATSPTSILALQWAVDHDIDVVNMSIGHPDGEPSRWGRPSRTRPPQGLLMVAASGNTVTLQEIFYGCPVAYPARYPQVLSTTFTNPNDALTGYSCTGPEVDFASPGDNIFSPVPGGLVPALLAQRLPAARAGRRWRRRTSPGRSRCCSTPGSRTPGTPGLFDDVRDRLCATANVGYGVQTVFGSTPIPTERSALPEVLRLRRARRGRGGARARRRPRPATSRRSRTTTPRR